MSLDIYRFIALEQFISCVNRRIPAYILPYAICLQLCRRGQLMTSQSLGGMRCDAMLSLAAREK